MLKAITIRELSNGYTKLNIVLWKASALPEFGIKRHKSFEVINDNTAKSLDSFPTYRRALTYAKSVLLGENEMFDTRYPARVAGTLR